MNTIWAIIKDGARALVVWLIISVLTYVFAGAEIGYSVAVLVGGIFFICFCIVTLGKLFGAFTSLGQRGQPPAWKPPASAPPAPPTPPIQQQYCPRCGAQWAAGAQRCVNCG
jgi:hypothetical protein